MKQPCILLLLLQFDLHLFISLLKLEANVAHLSSMRTLATHLWEIIFEN